MYQNLNLFNLLFCIATYA